jgi:hypothetical protein
MSCPHSGFLLGSHIVQCTWFYRYRGAYCLHLQDDLMTPFKRQFWLLCLAGNNLTSWSGFASSIQIIFWQPVYIKSYKKILGYYFIWQDLTWWHVIQWINCWNMRKFKTQCLDFWVSYVFKFVYLLITGSFFLFMGIFTSGWSGTKQHFTTGL